MNFDVAEEPLACDSQKTKQAHMTKQGVNEEQINRMRQNLGLISPGPPPLPRRHLPEDRSQKSAWTLTRSSLPSPASAPLPAGFLKNQVDCGPRGSSG